MPITTHTAKRIQRTRPQKQSSVSVGTSLPNGAPAWVTEQRDGEVAYNLLQQYLAGMIFRPALYAKLRELWGLEVFEGTLHCFENMKQRARKSYAPLDPCFEDFPGFLLHMGPRPARTASIDREKNRKGYSPENCRWADKITQSRNREITDTLTFMDETRPLTEWADWLGETAQTLRARRTRGWTVDEIFTGQRAPRIPANAPWPPHAKEEFEQAFQEAGGGGHYERLMFLRDFADKQIKYFTYLLVNENYGRQSEESRVKQETMWTRELEIAEQHYARADSELEQIRALRSRRSQSSSLTFVPIDQDDDDNDFE